MNNFTFAMKWHEILKKYSNDIRREVYDAVIEYVATGETIEMQPLSRMAFEFIRYDIDEKAKRKTERAAKKQQIPDNSEQTDSGMQQNETETQQYDTDSVHSDTDSVLIEAEPRKDNKEKQQYEIIAERFIAEGYAPPIGFITVTETGARLHVTPKHIRLLVEYCTKKLLEKGLSNYSDEADFVLSLSRYVIDVAYKLRIQIEKNKKLKVIPYKLWNRLLSKE